MTTLDIAKKIKESKPKLNKTSIYNALLQLIELSANDMRVLNQIHKFTLNKRKSIEAKKRYLDKIHKRKVQHGTTIRV